MIADGLTKALTHAKLHGFVKQINMNWQKGVKKAWITGPKKSPHQLQMRIPSRVRIPSCGFHPWCKLYRADSIMRMSLCKFHLQEPTPKSYQFNKPAPENQEKSLPKASAKGSKQLTGRKDRSTQHTATKTKSTRQAAKINRSNKRPPERKCKENHALRKKDYPLRSRALRHNLYNYIVSRVPDTHRN